MYAFKYNIPLVVAVHQVRTMSLIDLSQIIGYDKKNHELYDVR